MYRQSILSPKAKPKHEAYVSLKEQLQQQTAKLLRQRQNLIEINNKNKKYRVPTQQTIIQQSGLTSYARFEYLEQVELRRYKEKVKRICKKIQELIAFCGDDHQYQDIVESQKFILDFLSQFFSRLENSCKSTSGLGNQTQFKDSERSNVIKITQKQFIDENVVEIINQIQNKVLHQINALKEQNRVLFKKITEQQRGSIYQRNKCLELQSKIYNLSSLLDVKLRKAPALTFSRVPNTILPLSSEFMISSPQMPQSIRRESHYVLSKKNGGVHNQKKLYSFKNPEVISQFHIQDLKNKQNPYKSIEAQQIQENRGHEISKRIKNTCSPQEFYRSKIEDLKFEDSDVTNDMQKLAKVRSHPDFRTTVQTNSLSQIVNEKQRKGFMGRTNEQQRTEEKVRHSEISWPALNRFEVSLNTHKRYSVVKQ